MTTPEEYQNLADKAYEVDPLRRDPPVSVGERFRVGSGDHVQRYEVVATADHPANGFQAMAVAPIVGGVPDLTRIVVSYAGTNPGHRADLLEDAETIAGGDKGPLSQVADAQKFANRVKAAYPHSSLSTVGHSLGGYLALLVAAERGWPATTFNAPDPWEALSPHAKKRLTADNTAGRGMLRNYLNEWDIIGNLYGNRTGAAIYVADTRGRSTLEYHNIGKNGAFRFGPDGSLTGTGVKGHRFENILANAINTLAPGTAALAYPALIAASATAHTPAAMKVLAKGFSEITIAINTVAALGLATSIGMLKEQLTAIKHANARILPRMHEHLRTATTTAALLPTITETDIQQCLDRHRLHVHQNVDEEAVRAVNEQVDRHLQRITQLKDGITQSVRNTIEQDTRWATTLLP